MSCLLILGTCLVALSPLALNAEVVEFTFSGTLGSGLGVIQAGDAFSGTAIWDDSTIGNPVPNNAELTSLTLNLPAADGLSVPSLPDAAVLFAGAGYGGTDFHELQLNIKSSTDGNIYVFFIAATPGCPPDVCNAAVTNATFTQLARATSFTTNGPTPVPDNGPTTVPEPVSRPSAATGMALLLAVVLMRKKLLNKAA